MTLNKWFEKGLTQEQFISKFDNHKDGFDNIYEQFDIPNDISFFDALEKKKIKAIILAEVWCGHCMLNIPIFLKLANQVNMPVSILPRDENLELMDQYLTNGNRTIPIFIFIDDKGNEITTWGPMAENTRHFVNKYRKDLPNKNASNYNEQFKKYANTVSIAFQEDTSIWNGVYQSMKQKLTTFVHEN